MTHNCQDQETNRGQGRNVSPEHGAAVDNGGDKPKLGKNGFHPVYSPLLLRDDLGGGASNTKAHPAGELFHHNSPRVPILPLAVPPSQFCADARHVVSNPEAYAQRPILRRLAWATLMAERGGSVDQTRLAEMARAS